VSSRTVTVGTHACTAPAPGSWAANGGSVTCALPPGSGTGHLVTVAVFAGGIVSTAPPGGVAVAYAAPSVAGAVPQRLGTAGLVAVTITGADFGPAGSPGRAVAVGGSGCGAPVFDTVTHGSVVCLLPPGAGVGRVVTVTVDGRKSTVNGFYSF
jgi:hypothetical protein